MDDPMNLLHVSRHIPFLIELPAAFPNKACVRLVIRVCPLVREELVHAFEHFHAHLWPVDLFGLSEVMLRYTFKAAVLYHLVKSRK